MNPANPPKIPLLQSSKGPRKYLLVSSADLPAASDVGATRKV